MEYLLKILCLFYLVSSILKLFNLILKRRNQSCYILGYECFKPKEETKLNTNTCAKILFRKRSLGIEELRFLVKAMVSSGIGENTYGSKNFLEGRESCPTLKDTYEEIDEVMFDTLDNLFKKTCFSPSEIDILVVNLSLFSPIPSITSRIINRYKMREDLKVFNLSGMGCSASLIGGCAILLTNKTGLKKKAILKLKQIERTYFSTDEAYNCCIRLEDEEGFEGARLTKSLVNCAAQALTLNLKRMVPKILPLWELVWLFTVSLRNGIKKIQLKNGIEHFCVHPGGRAVIDGVGKGLMLNEYDLEPTRMALHRWGNTSSSGIWYVLGYMEAKKRLKEGDRILMISLGAGFKCNTCVWEVMRDLSDTNVWTDSIQSYPPPLLKNPFKEKFNWLNDDYLSFVSFVRLDFSTMKIDN
ncbi:unnamed protein product [Vicia faba]|uniref:3-ketoacyl-CoA synthase n=1 Tax=Vicia faba TaxID=3906 RepID=A0AAV0YBR1_VICFA|nr:unnamed protein product [Vicia faba]